MPPCADGRRSAATGTRYTVTPGIPAPSSFTTWPVITPVWAFALSEKKIRLTAEAQRTPKASREEPEPSLLFSLRFLGVLCASAVNMDNDLIALSPFGSDRSRALSVVDW